MMKESHPVSRGGLAPLKNVARCLTVMETLRTRGPHLPGLGVFHGYSGYGKTYAAILAQHKTNALRVEVGDSWTKKTLLQKILKEADAPARGTVADLTESVILTLGDDPNRP
ncbi:MAG: ATP-binding protein, partial [Roseibium sp.]